MFTDALEMTLELTISGTLFKIPGANIKFLKASVYPYGFTASLSFWVSSEKKEDKLLASFIKKDLITVKLAVSPHFKPSEIKVEPLMLQGFATSKAILKELTIENINLRGDPVLYRHYRLDFADPAQVLWRQHFPCDLQINGSVKKLIEANAVSGADLTCEWDILKTEFAMNVLSPGACENGASFYDFIIWYTASNHGVFTYDGKKNRYRLSGEKEQGGTTSIMSELEVDNYRIEFPETIRYNDRFLNAYANDPKISKTSRSEALENVRRDNLMREPIPADFDAAFNLESKKKKIRNHEISLIHARYPQFTCRPGSFVKCTGGLWSPQTFIYGKEYRVRDILLEVNAVDQGSDADHNLSYSRYHVDMQSSLELKTEEAAVIPPFKVPSYPILVEGKIVSEQGEDKEETYQIYQHPQSKLDQHKVKIPLFDNKEIVVPFEPLFAPGHFYFPPYKGERVLVALDFHSASIVGFLDWRSGGRLPQDTQGDHILLGKGAESNTSISHVYVDNKPQLNMKRTSSKDTEIIQLHEGTIILQTKEES